MIHAKTQSGFALLMTLLVVTVVVSVTLTIIELSLKQLALAVTAKESEIAFYAANAGMECARYGWRTASTSLQNIANPLNPDNEVRIRCFGREQGLRLTDASSLNESPATDGRIYRYRGNIDWGTNDRCSVVDMVLLVVPETETDDMQVTDFDTLFPGYPAGDVKTCVPGSTCLVTQVTGYSRPCSAASTVDTVRREILLEF